jgi:hypothetical protein
VAGEGLPCRNKPRPKAGTLTEVDTNERAEFAIKPVTNSSEIVPTQLHDAKQVGTTKKWGVSARKSNGGFKAAVQTFLQAVENNDLGLLKSYSSKSGDSAGIKENRVSHYSPSKSKIENDREKASIWRLDHETATPSKRQSSAEGSPIKPANPYGQSSIQIAFPLEEPAKRTVESDLVTTTPDVTRREREPPGSRLSKESEVAGSRERHSGSRRESRGKHSPVALFRVHKTSLPENTKLSPGEPLIGKTIEVRSSVKRNAISSLNESAGSGAWVRLLNLDSVDDSDDYDGDEEMMCESTGRLKESHPWRRDMVVRKVNSVDSDFSGLPLDTTTCHCTNSVFSGNDELVDFYLPLMGMACSCGARRSGPPLRNPEEPTSLENILRPWQAEFLASFGIYRGDQLVKACHRSGSALAKALRRYRKKHGMSSFQSKSCSMALGIWSKTSKAFVRSIRKQLIAGDVSDGIKVPNTLYILSSFLDNIPMDGSSLPRALHGMEGVRSSRQSEECSL